MLFKAQTLEAIARGEIDLAFRCWTRPTVKTGTRLRTPIGIVVIGEITPIDADTLTAMDAKRAGFKNVATLRDDLRNDGRRRLYRIVLEGVEPDGRIGLRDEELTEADIASLTGRFASWDGTASDGYHAQILQQISAHPGAPAANLATLLGVEKPKFKRDVRKLKELGLTISLDTGYRLSPRGKSLLEGLK